MNWNYFNTFIAVADDCPAVTAAVPEAKGDRKILARLQYEMIASHPYRYRQEDVLFETYADHKDIPASDRAAAREKFFSRGQPCLRASALGKRYGWGIHNNEDGRVALYPVESEEYRRLATDPHLAHLKAMRSKRA